MKVKTLPDLLDKMWQDYVSVNPMAKKVFDDLTAEGEKVLNDHIAFRTFNHPRICVDVLSKPFLASGYVFKGEYEFKEKKLLAKHFEHPDKSMPIIFISQLKIEEFSPRLREIVNKLVDQIPSGQEKEFDFSSTGRPWNLTTGEYKELQKESEYAAWLAAFGYRPNHFTVLVNALKKYNDIYALNEFLKQKGFKLNASGGEVKGTKEQLLEQSSTLANNIEVKFADGPLTIPACYYEFAKRYPTASGELYSGFIAASADKIFESTTQGQ